jgi:sugar (pentulose or hexulose) kinase
MVLDPPRGIAVVDAGATNTKIVLFSSKGERLAERKAASRHVEGPPYRHIDPEAVVELCSDALPELDRIAPIDVVVPCAHGAALALLAKDGMLAMPIMDYTAEPPDKVVEDYRRIEPPFSEVYCRLLPMALTHGLQLYWQQRQYPVQFARTAMIVTWIQYVGYMLGGRAVSEISSLSCQSQLMDVRENRFSSLARQRGWDRLFAPMAKAWEKAGELKPQFRGPGFRGRGVILAGVHDSNANYLRYLAAGLSSFTLLSSGTWIIGFNRSTPLSALKAERDTASNTDVLGRPVASCRFYGGREFEILAQGAPAEGASVAAVSRLVAKGTMALPSFTNSGGPIPNSGGKGRIDGEGPKSPEERASLAALYCALMMSESLDAIESRNDIIIDGPFAQNAVFVAVLAQLRALRSQRVLLSDLQEGTTAGAACLALFQDDKLPEIALALRKADASNVPGLLAYRADWRARVHGKLDSGFRRTDEYNSSN